MGQVTLRPYQPDDAPAMAQLYFDSARTPGPRRYTPEQVAAWAPADPASFRAPAEDGRHPGRRPRARRRRGLRRPRAGRPHRPPLLPSRHGRRRRGGTGPGRLIAHAEATGVAALHVEASELARSLFEWKGFGVVERRDFVLRGVPIHNYAMRRALA